MAIHYQCRCGANIRMPRNVAGKKARCNSCGYIFTVPLPELNPEPETIPLEQGEDRPAKSNPAASVPQVASETGELGDWLGEFAEHESAAKSAAAPTTRPTGPQPAGLPDATSTPATLLDFADKDDILAPEHRNPGLPRLQSGTMLADEERSGIIGPSRSYWADLAGSFFFFLDAGSMVTFVIIVLANLWTVPLSFAGAIGFAGLCFISGYLCTFYFAVIKETAAGEDELPNVWIDDIWHDLVFSMFRFSGAWGWVLMPATLYAIIRYITFGPGFSVSNLFSLAFVLKLFGGSLFVGLLHDPVFMGLVMVGLFFWPVVILGVALGGSFQGLWPHTIVMTALVAPLPYLALCAVLLIAAAINLCPYTETYADLLNAISSKTNRSLFWIVTLCNSMISAYAMIVAMRAVGLYYRHYKQKFPWVAE